MAELEPELAIAGISVSPSAGTDADQYWNSFTETIRAMLATLNTWWE
jgi:hypothetical protein